MCGAYGKRQPRFYFDDFGPFSCVIHSSTGILLVANPWRDVHLEAFLGLGGWMLLLREYRVRTPIVTGLNRCHQTQALLVEVYFVLGISRTVNQWALPSTDFSWYL
jgi:hypothetical protein